MDITRGSLVRIRFSPFVYLVAKLGYRRVIRNAIAGGRWLLSFLGQGPQRVALRVAAWEFLAVAYARRSRGLVWSFSGRL
jgi:hypothetical protein